MWCRSVYHQSTLPEALQPGQVGHDQIVEDFHPDLELPVGKLRQLGQPT